MGLVYFGERCFDASLVAFDKDGTLFNFHASWRPRFIRAVDQLVSQFPNRTELQAELFRILGYDAAVGTFWRRWPVCNGHKRSNGLCSDNRSAQILSTRFVLVPLRAAGKARVCTDTCRDRRSISGHRAGFALFFPTRTRSACCSNYQRRQRSNRSHFGQIQTFGNGRLCWLRRRSSASQTGARPAAGGSEDARCFCGRDCGGRGFGGGSSHGPFGRHGPGSGRANGGGQQGDARPPGRRGPGFDCRNSGGR